VAGAHGLRSFRLALVVVVALALAACTGGGSADDDPIDGPRVTGERPIQFQGAGNLRLSGTFTVPAAAAGGQVPAVLFVPTLGPGDRDGPIDTGGIPDRLYLDVSAALVDRGVATFRYDLRGTGLSRMEEGQRLTLDDLVADARAAVDFLTERAEVDAGRIALAAYDQGGIVALRLAADEPRVQRVALISVPGRPVPEVLADQVRAEFGPESAAAVLDIASGLVATGSLPPVDAIPAEHRQFLLAADPAFLAQVYAADPAADAARVRVPVLVVVGSASRGVAAADAERLRAALPSDRVVVGEGLGPTLQEVVAPVLDASDPAAGSGHEHDASVLPPAQGTRDEAAVSAIVDWLAADRL
jgi:pimeloyl-ACP methyl ester carboxylesterase